MKDTIAVLSTGDMGHSIALVLKNGGARVVTCLNGRSDRTKALAAQSGAEPLPDLESVVQQADVVLSVLVPARAVSLAEELAGVLIRTDSRPLVADCNAVSPNTVKAMAATIEAVGGRFVDAGIIGPPPKVGSDATRIYCSGKNAAELCLLNDYGLDIRVVGAEIGQASGLKMCYAALTKGLVALGTELHTAAQAMGLANPLRKELEASQPALLAWLERQVPNMPPKAYRWVGEMEEIAATFAEVGLTERILLGAADIYRLVERTPLGDETPENRKLGLSINEIAEILAHTVSSAEQPARPGT